MYFLNVPLVIGEDVLFYKKGRNYKKLKSLKGLRIGTIIGYIYTKEFWRDTRESKIDNTASDTYQVFKKVITGRNDMAVVNKIAGHYILKKMGKLDSVDYLSKGYVRKYTIALSKKPENKIYLKKFESGLKKIKRNNKYQKIINKYT